MKLRVGAVALALMPDAALAHGTLAGGGGFYAGLAHPFLAWEHTILLVGLGLSLGALGRLWARSPLWGLLIGLGMGLALGPFLGFAGSGTAVLLLAIVIGAALALALRLPVAVLTVLAVGTGAAVGLDTGMPIPPNMTAVEVYAPYFGVVVGAYLIVLNAMALSSVATRPPFTIAVRMAGSWIIAIALMVLALHLRQFTGAT